MHRKAPVFNTSVSLIPEKFRQIPIILLFLSFNGSIQQAVEIYQKDQNYLETIRRKANESR